MSTAFDFLAYRRDLQGGVKRHEKRLLLCRGDMVEAYRAGKDAALGFLRTFQGRP
jgi:hypothetical protein